MTDLANLPEDITPEDFFMEVLPEALGEVDIPDGVGTDRLQFNIEGDDGLHINIGIDDEGDLTIEEGDTDEPPIALTVTSDDFRSILAGEFRDKVRDATGEVAIGPKFLERSFLPDDKVQKIKAIKGDIQVKIEDTDEARTYVATMTVGGVTPNVDAPTCTVSFDFPTLIDMVTRKQPAQQLFFQGKIRVDGDMSIVLGLMSAMGAQPT